MTDAADEAGGEAIYSSEGLPPLAAPRAPKIRSEYASLSVEEDVLESAGTLVDPSSAEAVFGKGESAQDKMRRLQREIASLPATDESAKLAEQLASRIHVSPQQDLIQLIDTHLGSNTSKPDNKDGAETGTGIVYELYGGKLPPSTSSLEERLLKLEQLMGSSVQGESLLARIDEMEKKISRVDDKSMEEAATRAKVIRADLEAASKARSKLSSASSNADNKTMSELHSQLTQLEGISEHLPALTARLQQLAHLHVQSSNFVGRLSEAETSLSGIEGSLASVEHSLKNLELVVKDNIKTMDGNVKALEEKLK